MSRWPLWRLLVWIQAWLLGVAALHRYRPLHDEFLVPLLWGAAPALAIVAIWALVRAFEGPSAAGERRAGSVELVIAAGAVIASAAWAVEWVLEARNALARIDQMLGTATLIVDVSLTWLAVVACLAALTLDWLLSTARGELRGAMTWLRRTHVLVTVLHIGALFGSVWLLSRWPEAGPESPALFQQARAALHVFEFSRITVLPVQAGFAAIAVAVAALDSRSA